jgi:hypothetical protein
MVGDEAGQHRLAEVVLGHDSGPLTSPVPVYDTPYGRPRR